MLRPTPRAAVAAFPIVAEVRALRPKKAPSTVEPSKQLRMAYLSCMTTAEGHLAATVAIIKDKKRILPCAAYCEQEYNVAPGAKGDGYFVGVPCVLGKGGMEKIVEAKLDASESALLAESVQHVKDLVAVVKKLAAEKNEQGAVMFPKLV